MKKQSKLKKISSSPKETETISRLFAKDLFPGCIVSFLGDLGAGKTTFIKALVSEIIGIAPNEVSSPTFTYLHIYGTKLLLYHFDLYRFKDQKTFFQMGFDEYFDKKGICLIEWAEKIEAIIPKENLFIVKIKHLEKNRRIIEIK